MFSTPAHASSHVRESKTVLDSGFHAVDSGFQTLAVDLTFWIPIVSGIPDSLSCIPDSTSKIFPGKTFGFHEQNISGLQQWDSGFLELYSGFHQQIFPEKTFGFHEQNISRFQPPRVIVFVSLYDAVSRTPIDVHFSHFPETN